MRALTKIVLAFVVIVQIIGCAQKPEIKGSWVSIEKPPIRIIYMNKADTISPEVVFGLVKQVEAHPYKDYTFNDMVGVNFTAQANSNSNVSNNSSLSVSSSK